MGRGIKLAGIGLGAALAVTAICASSALAVPTPRLVFAGVGKEAKVFATISLLQNTIPGVRCSEFPHGTLHNEKPTDVDKLEHSTVSECDFVFGSPGEVEAEEPIEDGETITGNFKAIDFKENGFAEVIGGSVTYRLIDLENTGANCSYRVTKMEGNAVPLVSAFSGIAFGSLLVKVSSPSCTGMRSFPFEVSVTPFNSRTPFVGTVVG